MNDHEQENCPAGWSGVTVPDGTEAPKEKERDNRKRDSELLATERICRIIEDDIPAPARPRVIAYLGDRYGLAERQAPRSFIESIMNPKP